jgi:hypothetical protein
LSIPIGLYQHFKGAYYRVMDVAKHSETEEVLVVYRALYGEKNVWVRPLSMFSETVEREGLIKPRFSYLNPQTQVLELAILDVKPGQEKKFEEAFSEAKFIIKKMNGYISHDLQKCVENMSRYALLVNWQTLEDHEIGFRESGEYQEWKTLLHDFYEPFPTVQHFQKM